MSEVPQDAWFYTQEGERMGPVTLAELRVKAQEARLNPRLDMVWSAGMAEWKPAGEIEGLFEKRRAATPQESLAPAANSYTPPQLESVEAAMARIVDWPGARRRSYLFAMIVFPVVWPCFIVLISSTGILTQLFGPSITGVIGIGAAFLPMLVALYFSLSRLVNLGMSCWWWFANLVPFLNLWVGYRCFACPAGFAYHKKLDGTGVFLAIVYWLLVVLGILALVAVIAMLGETLGSPELLERMRETILKNIQGFTLK